MRARPSNAFDYPPPSRRCAEDARGNDFDPVQPTTCVAGNGAKAVISIGRPYKFAGGAPASVKQAQVLRRYIAMPGTRHGGDTC